MTHGPSTPMNGWGRRGGYRSFPNGPRYPQLNRGGYPSPHKPHLQDNSDWHRWPEVTVRVSGFPLDFNVNTLDIHRVFSSNGQISRITIPQFAEGGVNDSAMVTFSPPPKRAFWENHLQTLTSANGHAFTVTLTKLGLRVFSLPSPVDANERYPEHMAIKASTLDFGVRHQAHEMMVMQSLSKQKENNVNFAVDLRRKELVVSFTLAMPDMDEEDLTSSAENSSMSSQDSDTMQQCLYKFAIPFQQIGEIWKVETESSGVDIFMPLTIPPRFYRKRIEIESTHQSDSKSWHLDSDAFYRQTSITRNRHSLKHAPCSLRRQSPEIDTGRWLMYRIALDAEVAKSPEWLQMEQAMSHFNIGLSFPPSVSLVPRKETEFWDFIDHPQNPSADNLSLLKSVDAPNAVSLSFEVQYQLEVCISQGVLHESNLDAGFLGRLSRLPKREALRLLETAADRGHRLFDSSTVFDPTLPRSSMTMSTARRLPSHCIWQRTATVTPTSIYFSSPSVEVTNRIIRKYREHGDRFLRVRFSDEKQQGRIHAVDNDSNDPIFTRIKRCMKNGITIGDRHFEYLASGNAQFREHGAYFFASTPTLTVSRIRKEMGDFSDIRVIAKYASRVGLCFSTTYPINGTKVNIVQISDVEKHGHNFTDGVGKISPFLARMIANESGCQGGSQDPPSLFQFRMAGCKGVLAVSPEVGARDVHIRKSQYKFPAVLEGLEIIRSATFASTQLNRQLINILTCLGVSDEVFLIKQKKQLFRLKQAMTDETMALDLLQTRVDANQATLNVASMILDGFMKTSEPFVMSLLRLWRAWSVKTLKEKASLDIEDGAFVLGCVDETDTLRGHLKTDLNNTEHNEEKLPEIFLQVSDLQNPGRYRIITGKCILARNPSLHPGDIRVVKAVNVSELHHHKNAVVFPRCGYRDLPSMCSGGDLDGDDFFISWDEQLFPEDWNVEPMDYKGPTPISVDRDVTIDDITSFFVNYMKNDALGRIANAHLANADCESDGARNIKCLKLAHLHSNAVDYVKTGVPAQMPRHLKPKKYPHFLENKNRRPDKVQKSLTVLGQLYDMVQYEDFQPSLDQPFDQRILTAFTLDEDILECAANIKQEYDGALRRIMAQHEIGSEFEVWTTFVLRHARLSNDYKFHEEMRRISDTLKERFIATCQEKAGGTDYEKIAPFAAAMYTVTARQVRHETEVFNKWNEEAPRPMQPSERPLMSFPWLFQKELGKIANGKRRLGGTQSVKAQQSASKPRHHKAGDASVGQGDVITSTGLAQRGDTLELFQNDFPNTTSRDELAGRPRKDTTLPPADAVPPQYLQMSSNAQLLKSLQLELSPDSEPPRDVTKAHRGPDDDLIDVPTGHRKSRASHEPMTGASHDISAPTSNKTDRLNKEDKSFHYASLHPHARDTGHSKAVEDDDNDDDDDGNDDEGEGEEEEEDIVDFDDDDLKNLEGLLTR